MIETKKPVYVYESDLLAVPPIRLVLGTIPASSPMIKRTFNNTNSMDRHELVDPVKRLIAHLEEKKD
jgi:hypothetical protein